MALTIEELSVFCKKKGFVFANSEIYGGIAGFWDYGPLGVELFNNLKRHWWKFFVQDRENMVGIDASIISHPKVWKASGHIAHFSDVSVQCKKCKKYNKVDKAGLGKAKCSFCQGELITETAKDLNLMFQTSVGPVAELSQAGFLRPETAQAMFLNFRLIAETSRVKLPFGIAQIGKCFRNEIAPRDFLFRDREFTIGEFEFFLHPEKTKCPILGKKHLQTALRLLDAQSQEEGKERLQATSIGQMLKENRLNEWHGFWLAEQLLWFHEVGLGDGIKVREHMRNELSHYSSA
ncbi:glycine--tRNA ligase, partial [Candidatus Woesearchaeota archaeon]|nr:glycine--tRNA ligase [Candidatus Woesearchaeota archaeon]